MQATIKMVQKLSQCIIDFVQGDSLIISDSLMKSISEIRNKQAEIYFSLRTSQSKQVCEHFNTLNSALASFQQNIKTIAKSKEISSSLADNLKKQHLYLLANKMKDVNLDQSKPLMESYLQFIFNIYELLYNFSKDMWNRIRTKTH